MADDGKTGNRKKGSAHVKRLKNLMLFIYIFIIVALSTVISILTTNKTDEVLKSKVVSMTSSLNIQMKMNLNSYIERMETIGTLIFALDDVYEYDATDASNDEYEAIKTEDAIEKHLYDICIMENFVDFSIVYSNGHCVGKMSNGTVKLFGDRLYEDLSSMINRSVTVDGWSTGYNDDYKRIYYVKKINDNALLVLSFYASELNDVFEHPGGIEDITVRLIDDRDVVIYSSDDKQTGKPLPEDILKKISGKSSVTFMDDEYLLTINNCGDNWRVVCSAPTHKILKEKNEVTYYIYLIAIIAEIFAAVISIVLMAKIITPVTSIVDALDDEAHTDLLTGVLNKRSFEKFTEDALRKSDAENKKGALILIDVDNFKGVNDTLGHAYGDKVLAEIGNIMRKVFRAEDCLGRIGGDEFCVYLNISGVQQENYMSIIEEKCNVLCKMFHSNYTGDDNSYKISASVGVAVFPMHGKKFSDLYKCADKALYSSKHKGKDTFTIYACGDETEATE